mmetsp:Transcript_9194/g.9111  ORF Transcript_9194/g.9111 Transcript_9194/m.9111 type:complete len:267 (+) Transcript_9194:512-1312(+)
MASISKSIAVFGGNGFLGKKICETGIKLGYKVTSFSRSGQAPAISSPWVKEVKWEKADIFNPETYKDKLANVNSVVHSIGLLFENQNYKKTMNTNFNFLNDVQNLANMVKSPNPMDRDSHNTYEGIQRDSAVILADTFLKVQPNNPSYVYISADQKIPFIPSGYIDTKREAEFELSCKEGLRSILMRPGFMYDESESHSLNNRILLKNLLKLGYDAKHCILGENLSYLNKLIRPPISTDKVARKIFEKLENDTFSGIVTLDEIYKH